MKNKQVESIANQIREYIIQSLFRENTEEGEVIDLNYPLLGSGLVDSVSMIMMIDHLEKTFEISFDVHEIARNRFDTIWLIAIQVHRKMQHPACRLEFESH